MKYLVILQILGVVHLKFIMWDFAILYKVILYNNKPIFIVRILRFGDCMVYLVNM